MANINFVDNLYDTRDNQYIISMVNEYIDMAGYACIFKRWTNIGAQLDDLYQDLPSYKEMDRNNNLYQNIHTRVVINYERFNRVLQSYGMTLEENLALEGMMKLEDKPTEDDIIQILYTIDQKYYSFKISSADIHANICYRVQLIPYYQDVKEDNVLDFNEPHRENKPLKQIEINSLPDDEIIRI